MHLKSIVHSFLRYPESRCLQVALEKILPVERLPLSWWGRLRFILRRDIFDVGRRGNPHGVRFRLLGLLAVLLRGRGCVALRRRRRVRVFHFLSSNLLVLARASTRLGCVLLLLVGFGGKIGRLRIEFALFRIVPV